MAKTKFGVNDHVTTESGFTPYEGPLPKPNVIYFVEQKSAVMKVTGDQAKTPGVEYIRGMWEVIEGECKGFTTFHNVVPGESDFQQIRIAQYMQAVCGKNAADVVHDDLDDGGKISKIGGKNPVGVKAGMTFQRKKDSFGVMEGDEPTWKAETNDLIPGWKPKAVSAHPLPDEVEDAEEEYEDDYDPSEQDPEDDVEEEQEEAPAPPVTRRRAKPAAAPEPEPEPEEEEEEDDVEDAGEDGDSEDDEDEVVDYATASAMSLVELKKLAEDYEYTAAELAPFKGPAGKKKLLAKLVEDEIVEAEAGDDEPPF